MLGNIRLYENYARLVVCSFDLQGASEGSATEEAFSKVCQRPHCTRANAQYQAAAARLITSFESDLDAPGITRGSPDFVFTVLTYAAVSLLRALQVQYAHLEPDRGKILDLARKAADMLARSAMTGDHLPAGQSVFLSRLIEVKVCRPAQGICGADFRPRRSRHPCSPQVSPTLHSATNPPPSTSLRLPTPSMRTSANRSGRPCPRGSTSRQPSLPRVPRNRKRRTSTRVARRDPRNQQI